MYNIKHVFHYNFLTSFSYQVDYLPSGWLVFYYKPSNGFHYMSDKGRFFNSAKRVMDFLTKNNYDPQIAKDVKTKEDTKDVRDGKKGTKEEQDEPRDSSAPPGGRRRQ